MARKTIYEDKILRREIELKAQNDFQERLSADEVSMCILTMERKRVSFFADHMWPNRRQGKLVWSLTADGRRAIAHQNGLAGMDPIEFEVGENGYPTVARVKVYRLRAGNPNIRDEYHGEARWEEFVEKRRDGSVNSQWKRRPFNQLGKCAEMQALRRGFPEGDFSDDPVVAIEEPHDVEAESEPAPEKQPSDHDKKVNEVVTWAQGSPAPQPPPEPEPEPVPDPEPEPVPAPAEELAEGPKLKTLESVRTEGLPLLKAYCELYNGGTGMSWKAVYKELAGVVMDGKDMDVGDYEVLIACLKDKLSEAKPGEAEAS
jgi:hypothetical protein